jgi:hypothetical protein
MRGRLAPIVVVGLVTAAVAACRSPLGPAYEYEEQVYLSVDGSATVLIDASLPAFETLRGLRFSAPDRAGKAREEARSQFADGGCGRVRASQPWTRRGRWYVQVRVDVERIELLASCAPLAWSSYLLEQDEVGLRYRQVVGPPEGDAPDRVNWDGSELVAFKLHVPSRVYYHNVRRLEDGEPGAPDRGNILTWEQRLTDRRAGRPVHLDVRMGADSILLRTLWLFGGALVAAVAVLVAAIWLMLRKGRRDRASSPVTRPAVDTRFSARPPA